MNKVIKQIESELRFLEKEDNILNELIDMKLPEISIEKLFEMRNENCLKTIELLKLCDKLDILIKYNDNCEIELYKEN